MINQILLYVSYGLGALFLIGGTILMVGILKPTSEQAAAKKAAKEEALAAKKAAKEDKKSMFGASARKKDFFVTEDIGEGGNNFQLEDVPQAPQKQDNTIPSPAFEVPTNNTPPKSSFQAAAFAAKRGEPVNPEATTPSAPSINLPDLEEELPQPKPAPKLPPTQNKSVFGGGDFKLSEGSDSGKDNNPDKSRFNLPF